VAATAIPNRTHPAFRTGPLIALIHPTLSPASIFANRTEPISRCPARTALGNTSGKFKARGTFLSWDPDSSGRTSGSSHLHANKRSQVSRVFLPFRRSKSRTRHNFSRGSRIDSAHVSRRIVAPGSWIPPIRGINQDQRTISLSFHTSSLWAIRLRYFCQSHKRHETLSFLRHKPS
jgi:hypothetical protein